MTFIPFFEKEEAPLKHITCLFSLLLISQVVIAYLQIVTWYGIGQDAFYTIFKHPYMNYLHNGISFNKNLLRVSGGSFNPNFFALLLILSFPYWFVKTVFNNSAPYRFSISDLLKALGLLILILFSFSRSAYLVILIVGMIFIYQYYRKQKLSYMNKKIIWGGIVIIVLFLLFTPFGSRLRQLTPADDSILNRFLVITATLKIITQKFIYTFWGTGTDQYMHHAKILYPTDSIEAGYYNPHSTWFQILSDSGLIGLGLFSSIFIAFWSRIRTLKIPSRSITYGIFISLMMALLIALSENFCMDLIDTLIFWFQVGVLAFLLWQEKQKGPISWIEKYLPYISVFIVISYVFVLIAERI